MHFKISEDFWSTAFNKSYLVARSSKYHFNIMLIPMTKRYVIPIGPIRLQLTYCVIYNLINLSVSYIIYSYYGLGGYKLQYNTIQYNTNENL